VKEIPLTQGYVALVDDDDYEWLNQWKWFVLVCKRTSYAVRNSRVTDGLPRHLIYMHRVLMGKLNEAQVDHIHHNGLDCRRLELRACSVAQNAYNRGKQAGSSRYKGVSWYPQLGKWVAQIHPNGTRKHLGYFDSETAAAAAYNKAAREYWGEFAFVNQF
jgi:hypothetical protein